MPIGKDLSTANARIHLASEMTSVKSPERMKLVHVTLIALHNKTFSSLFDGFPSSFFKQRFSVIYPYLNHLDNLP